MHLICLLAIAMAKHVQRLWTRARALAVGDFASVATRLYLQLSSALIIYFDVLFYEQWFAVGAVLDVSCGHLAARRQRVRRG